MKYFRRILIVVVSMIAGTIYAQDEKHYTIGLLGFFDIAPVVSELNSLGYIEGENVTYLFPLIEGWETLAPEEIGMAYQEAYMSVATADVDIFVTNTDTDAINLVPLLKNPDTPIVFARSDDPVATGAVADLVTPGGNITGNITNRPHERRLQVLTEINPETDAVYYLYSVMTGEAETVLEQVKLVGESLGVEVIPAPITDIAGAFELIAETPEHIDWLFMTPYVPFDFALQGAIVAKSVELKAGIAGVTNQPTLGYAVGYGPDLNLSDRQAARTVDRILRGADPAELPVQIAENLLTINLEASDAIALEVPVGVLRQANLIVRPGDFDETGLYIGNG